MPHPQFLGLGAVFVSQLRIWKASSEIEEQKLSKLPFCSGCTSLINQSSVFYWATSVKTPRTQNPAVKYPPGLLALLLRPVFERLERAQALGVGSLPLAALGERVLLSGREVCRQLLELAVVKQLLGLQL